MLAGDTVPIDVYCHIPIMCEERSIPYAYVPSKTVSAEEEPRLCPEPSRGGADSVSE